MSQLVPLQYRLLVINAVNVPWNTFLSIQNQKAKHGAAGLVDTAQAKLKGL